MNSKQERAYQVASRLSRYTPAQMRAWIVALNARELDEVIAMEAVLEELVEQFHQLCQAAADRQLQDQAGPEF
jgi:hypothetical protein